MGIHLKDIVKKSETDFKSLSYKWVAFDSFNMLHQFLASIRQYDGTPLMDSHGNPTGHLSGLFYRTVSFLEHNIKPVFVFDGKKPKWKAKTVAERIERKKIAEMKYLEALEAGMIEDQKKFASMTGRLTSPMVEESKRLLDLLGVPHLTAPSEAEAQASCMCSKGLVYAVGSQDYDSLLFGAERLLKNMSITGRRKTRTGYIDIKPEIISLQDTLSSLGITREKLIWLGLLVGTDFNEGIMGLGPKKSLKLVLKYESFSELVEKESLRFEEGYETILEIIDFFQNPEYLEFDPSQLKLRKPDEQGILDYLCGEREFSEDRVRNSLQKISNVEKGQSTLGDFF